MANFGWFFNFNRFVQLRSFSTSSINHGKRNFRKFQALNKRGTKDYREGKLEECFRDSRGVRPTSANLEYTEKDVIPEMIPELIVPDLTDFNLKPYVSYRAEDIKQSEFTARDLFNAVYGNKIIEDFKSGGLDEHGNPLNPSEDESLNPEQAWINARKTGSDMF